jgi:hypothetical protein
MNLRAIVLGTFVVVASFFGALGVAYDDKTLRLIANANGTVNATVSSLNMQ